MKRIIIFVAFAVSFLCRVGAENKVYEVKSPDNKICFSFKVDEDQNLVYKVSVKGKDVIDWSGTGYSMSPEGTADKISVLMPKSKKPIKFNGEWRPVWGKRAVVKDICTSWTIDLQTVSDGFMVLDILVYNDG
ncbi:MAG: glycoside hydrolase family 97 N-terminal domain-containing protein, partial [Bacteroidaceae bacterium]|nr:glycoside hydrolase family 97 N-terminal domain-containing protein [Bacteroidaceae bacterium]